MSTNTPAAPAALTALTRDQLTAWLREQGQPAFRAGQILRWIFDRRARAFADMTDLPLPLRQLLQQHFTIPLPETVLEKISTDTTRKFLLRLHDGRLIESVLIPATESQDGERSDRRTLCVSSQVGCAYGCKFCASGLNGWTRHLAPDEIIGQVLRAEELSGERVDNIVFMGMGEPLANFDNLMQAIAVLNSPWGVNIGARHITVSTSGLVPKIIALADQPLQLRLAISLHGATDPVREHIMPVNRRWGVDELLDACAYYQSRKKQKIFFEYILIHEVNDTLDQADALIHQINRHKLDCKVNLIPYNTVQGLDWRRPSVRRQRIFLDALRRANIFSTIRTEKGHDIDAACGQLRLQNLDLEPAPALALAP